VHKMICKNCVKFVQKKKKEDIIMIIKKCKEKKRFCQ
jgi:hypothetical protein